MFRMKFQSTVDDYSTSSDEEEEAWSTGRQDAPVSTCKPSATKVVLFEKIRPLSSPDNTPSPHLADGEVSSLRSMILSPSAAHVGPDVPSSKLRKLDPDVPAQVPADSTPQLQATGVLGEESTPETHSLTDKTAILTYLHHEDSITGQDSKMDVLVDSAPGSALLDSSSTSKTSDSECSTSNEDEEDDSVTGMINELLQDRINILQKKDDKFDKPLKEPLLAAHDQEELDLIAKEEAKVEAQRLAEEERLEREQQLRELRALALCSTVIPPSLERSPAFTTKRKAKGIWGKRVVTRFYRLLKRPFRIFRSRKRYTDEYDPDAREANVIVPKAGMFRGFWSTDRQPRSETTDSHLAMMRNAPNLGGMTSRRPQMQFKTVESTQRDVPAWTREEYLKKNGRIPRNSSDKELEDEEFGGIEANNLMNQYFDDGVLTDYDSDSD